MPRNFCSMNVTISAPVISDHGMKLAENIDALSVMPLLSIVNTGSVEFKRIKANIAMVPKNKIQIHPMIVPIISIPISTSGNKTIHTPAIAKAIAPRSIVKTWLRLE